MPSVTKWNLAILDVVDERNCLPLTGLAVALRELGKIERMLFLLHYISSIELRGASMLGATRAGRKRRRWRSFFVVGIRIIHQGSQSFFGRAEAPFMLPLRSSPIPIETGESSSLNEPSSGLYRRPLGRDR
jgi:hypothetical protein